MEPHLPRRRQSYSQPHLPHREQRPPSPLTAHRSSLTAQLSPLTALPQADDADKVKAILLSQQTERLLLNTNWKVRSNLNHHLRKRASQFGVDVPPEFGAYNVRPRNTCAH